MKAQSVLFGSLLALLISDLIDCQRIRTGRCPAISKRLDCPIYVWDDCTCDLDCPGVKKCCFDGCRHACLEADTTQPSLRSKADVVFVMDSSGSIGSEDYRREKQFVKELTNVFTISPTGARVATIIYSDNPKLIFDFDRYQDKASINDAIDDLEFLGNRTRIDKALAMAQRVFSNSRPSVPRIAFVLTDGKQTEDFDAKPLDVAARPLHDLGVQVYVIGIGGHVDLDELELIAKRPQDLFTVDSFERLLQQIYRIVNRFDTTDIAPPLELTADMLFLVDSSSAIPQSEYVLEKYFLKNVIGLFNISPRYVRAGIISYGNTAQLWVPLDRFTTNEAINRSIDNLPYIGGKKRLDRALQVANQAFSRSRPLVPKIIVALARDGELTDPGADYLRKPVQALRNSGVGIFVIGIGENLDLTGLKRVVARSNDVITDKSHRDILPYLPSLARYIGWRTDFSTPLDEKTDVIFAIDTSEDVEVNDFKRQREFVNSLARSFKISKYGARASVLTYGKLAYPFIRFADFVDINDFVFKMDRIREVGGVRRMDLALKRAVRIFREYSRNGPKIVLLFTAGPQAWTKINEFDAAMKELERLGVRIYVIAIGSLVKYLEITKLVNSTDDIIQVPSFIDLQSEVHAVGRYISLSHGLAGSQRYFIADVVFLMDSSAGVGRENYPVIKEFVKAVAQALNHGEKSTRSALIIYGNDPRLLARFNTHKTLEGFKSVVDGAPYLSGARRIDKALEYAAQVIRGARSTLPKIVVLLTSGPQTAATGAKSLDVASRPLKHLGAKSFIATIGRNPNIWELRPVVEKLEDILRVPSFPALPPKSNFFAQHVILNSGLTDPQTTNVNADVVFLMDSSQTITRDAFQKQKAFLTSLAKHLNVSPSRSRAAVISYGSRASVVRQLNSEVQFEQSVGSAPIVGGARRMDRALQDAARVLSAARPSVPIIIVLLTAGRQQFGSPSPEIAARSLHSLGARPFAVAIGIEPDESGLRRVVKNHDDLFKVPSFNELPSNAYSLAKQIEENLQEEIPVTNVDADVIFLMDSSQTVTQGDFVKEKNFVRSMTKHLNVAPGKSRAAIISYGSTPAVVRLLDSRDTVRKSVENAPLVGGGRRMDRAIQESARLLSSARRSVPKIVILLTEGKQPIRTPSLGSAAGLLRSLNARPFAIAIGREPDITELRKLLERPEDVFNIPSFTGLEQSVILLAKGIEDNLQQVSPATNVNVDVVFVMDSSQTVSNDDYKREKSFVKSIAKHLNVSPRRSRAAVISYGSTAYVVRQLGSRVEFEESVDSAPSMGGGRRMDRALQEAVKLLSSARPSASKIIVLLTAGTQQRTSPSPEFAGRLLRTVGGRPFVVAIGQEPNERELRKVVEKSDDVLTVLSFTGLLPQAASFAKKIESREKEVPPDFQTDIVFVMDSSREVTRDEYAKEKDFVTSVARTLNLAPGRTRAAVLTYGFISRLVADFDSYPSFPLFKNGIDTATYIGGTRRIDKALDQASQLLAGARSLFPKIVVLLTAGRQSSEPGAKSLELAARPLHEHEAKTFIVTIGDRPNLKELQPIVKDKTSLSSVSSFDDLQEHVPNVASELVDQSAPEKPDETDADYLFIVDSSASVSTDDYSQEKVFIKFLTRDLDVSRTNSRVALITYGSVPRVVFRFDTDKSVDALEEKIDSAPSVGGGRRIDRALDEAALVMRDARPSIPKVVILVTAGGQVQGSGVQPLNIPAKALQDTGSRTYVIEVGGRASFQELRPVVKFDGDIFSVGKFTDLPLIFRHFASEITNKPKGLQQPRFNGDVVFLVDASIQVSSEDFSKEKDFVKELARILDAPSKSSRAAVMLYDAFPTTAVGFESHKDLPTFERAVDSLTKLEGRRRIDRALIAAARILQPDRPSTVVLITAGKQAVDPDTRVLGAAVQPLKRLGTKIFVVAIGGESLVTELSPAVEDRKSLFLVPDFDGLQSATRSIASHIVTRQEKPSDTPMDLIFLVDASSAVSPENYKKEMEFVASIAEQLQFGSGKTRVSVILYSDYARLAIRFDVFKTPESLRLGLNGLPRLGGLRRIDRALDSAARTFVTSRPDARNVVILLTAGRQTQEEGAKSLLDATEPLKKVGAERYVVAIGTDSSKEELKPVVERPSDVMSVSSFNLLKPQSPAIAEYILKESKPAVQFAADVVFLVDSSSDVPRNNFEREKDFVKSVAEIFQADQQASRAAVLSFGDQTIQHFSLSDTIGDLASAVGTTPYVDGRRRTDLAILKAAEILQRARFSVPKVVILVTAGISDAIALLNASQAIRDVGATLYVVAIGGGFLRRQFEPLVETKSDIFDVPTFAGLQDKSESTAKDIASRAQLLPGKVYDVVADIVFLVDSSVGVGEKSLQIEKDFLKNAARFLNLAPNKSRVSVIVYSNYPQLPIRFDDYKTSVEFDKAVEEISYVGNNRRIDRALEVATGVLRSGRTNIPKTVILLTAGNQVKETGVKLLSEFTSSLEALKARAFVVAIGQEPNVSELDPIVTSNKDLFTVPSFQAIESETRPMIKHIAENIVAEPRPEDKLNVTVDVVFLLDGSLGISPEDFKDEKDFVQELTSLLNVASGKSRAAVILYGGYVNPRNVLIFKQWTPKELETAMNEFFLVQGRRRIDEALDFAWRLFDLYGSNSSKVVVLLTGGKQAQVSGAKPLKDAVIPLKAKGVKTFVVAIGSADKELRPVVDEEDDLQTVPSFGNLDTLPGTIAKQIANSLETKPPAQFAAEIVFLVDSSSDVIFNNFGKEKDFVKSVVELFKVDQNVSRAAVITYGDRPLRHLNLEKSGDDVPGAVDRTPYIGGRRRMDRAFLKAAETLEGARFSVPKIVILLTGGANDGNTDDVRLLNGSQAIRDAGASLYVVAIEGADQRELDSIVENENDVYEVSTFSNLPAQSESIANDISKRAQRLPEPVYDVTADVVFLVDSAFGVGKKNFQVEKDFVRNVAHSLNLTRDKSRFSVIVYSTYPRLRIRFNDHERSSTFNEAVENLPYIGSSRRIDRALDAAIGVLRNGRPGVPKVVVLITAGKQANELGAESLSEVVLPLESLKAKTFVVAIGQEPDFGELGSVVASNKDLFTVPSFKALEFRTRPVIKHIAVTIEKPAVQKFDFKGDIIFLLDSSFGVSQQDFKKQKEFVKFLATALNLAPESSRVAILVYSSYTRVAFRFGILQIPEALGNRLDGLPRFPEVRRIDRALETASRVFDDSKPGNEKVVVLLTAGRQSSGGKPLGEASQPLRTLGANTYVIAIGSQVSVRELTPVVDRTNDILKISSFDELVPKTDVIAKHIADKKVDPETPLSDNYEADIVFIVDSSRTVSNRDFVQEKGFVKTMARLLNVPSQKSRAAFISYGSTPTLVLRFSGYKTISQFDSAVDTAPYKNGTRRMELALEYAGRLLLEARQSVPRVVIFLTSGLQSQEYGVKPLTEAGKQLREYGAKTFVLAIGAEPDVDELKPVVQDPSNIFEVQTFRSLKPRAKAVADEIVEKTTAIPEDFKADVLFIMDSSSLATNDDFIQEKEFVKSMMRSFKVKRGQSRAAIITYGSSSLKVLRFDSYLSVNYIDSAIDSATYMGGAARIDKALEDANELLTDSNSATPRIVVLLTTGAQADDSRKEAVDAAAQQLHNLGARVYVIAVGNVRDIDHLGQVADHPRDVFRVQSFKGLSPSTSEITNNIIESFGEPKPVRPLDFSADIIFVIDSSSEVSQEDLKAEKDFVKSLAETLNLNPDGSRGAIINYGSFAEVAVRFSQRSNSTAFGEAVDSLLLLGGSRRMDYALQEAATLMNQARPDAPKVIIFLTAGKQSGIDADESIRKSVEPLRTLGSHVFVVAVGEQPENKELQLIAEEPSNIRKISDFAALTRQTALIARHIVNQSNTSIPNQDVVKVVFLLDSSSGVTRSDFAKEVEFIKTLVRSHQFPLKDSKMAIVSYSFFVSTSGTLDSYTSLVEFDKAADSLDYIGGPRRMDNALDAASMILGRDKSPGRHIVVLLTGGRQDRQSEVLLTEKREQFQNLRASIYVVAVGSEPSLEELSPIVEDPRDIHQVPSFDLLPREADSLAHHIRSGRSPVDLSADIVFIVDSSDAVGRDNYVKEKEFVKSLSRMFNVSPGKSRSSVIVYNVAPILAVRYGGYKSKQEFDNEVDRLPYLGGQLSRLDRALESSARVLNSARQDVPRIVILLTAGRSGASGGSLLSASQKLSNLGAKTFVIAIGQQVDQRELNSIVEKSGDVFTVSSFSEILPRAPLYAVTIADRLAPEPEDIAADVIFLIESSSTVTSSNFNLEKGFVKTLARSLNVSPDMSRASVIVYGSRASIVLSLEEFTNLNDFQRTVDLASYVSGARRIDLALEAAAAVMNQARTGVPKILVLLTAGRQATTGDPKPLTDAVKPLRDLGARTYVVAIGSEPDKPELTKLVENSGDIFEVPTFGELGLKSTAIAKSIAENSRPKPHNMTADVVFAVDTSSSIAQKNFNNMKRFVISLARSLSGSAGTLRAALIAYSDTAITLTKLSEEKSKEQFNTIVNDMTLLDGESRIDKALDSAVSLLSEGRPEIPKIVVVLSASQQSKNIDSGEVLSSVESLRRLEAKTFVVAIGNDTDTKELVSITEKPDDLLTVTAFDKLQSRVPEIAKDIAASAEPEVADIAADVVFLLDSSSFVTQENFKEEKRFVKSLARVLNVAPGYSRAAMVLYGTSTITAVRFNGYRTLDEFNSLVDVASQTGGSRRIDRALEAAANLLVEGRRHAPKIVVLLTAGRQTASFGNIPPEVAVQTLKRLGAKTFFVAVGRDADTTEITSAAEEPDDVFTVSSFNYLGASVPRITRHITSRSMPRPQNITADIVFLVDSSNSVGLDDLDKEKGFVKSLARSLNISPGSSRAAVIAYSSAPKTIITFTDYPTSEDFNQMLDRVPLLGAARRIDRALEAAGTLLSQARMNVPKFVILLTSGKQAVSIDAKPLSSVGQFLKNLKVKTFVVTVGSEPDLKELRPIVHDAEDIFGVPAFDDLRPEVQPIAKHIYQSLEPALNITSDLVFLIDASTSVGRENFKNEKEFIKALARTLNVSPGQSRAALITYSTNPFTVLPLGGYSSVKDFERKLDEVAFYGGNRRMDRALMEAIRLLKSARPNVDRKVILLTAGRQTQASDEEPFNNLKKSLQDVGARPFIVTFGRDHDIRSLEAAVVEPSDIFNVTSLDDLVPNVGRIAKEIADKKSIPLEKDYPYVVFLVDSSSPVQPDQFQKEKDFIKLLAKSLNLAKGEKTEAAVISYGSQSFVGITFDQYRTLKDFELRVDNIRSVGGSRRMDRALDAAALALRQAKPSSPKIVLLLTTGRQASETDSRPLEKAAQPLKEIGAKIYVLAVGGDSSIRELRPVVNKLQDIFRIPMYDDMEREEPRVAEHIITETPIFKDSRQVEVLFVMDSSALVSREDYEKEKAFVISLAKSLNVSPKSSKAAVMTYGDRTLMVMNLDNYSMPEFESIIGSSQYIGRAGRMDQALREAANVFSTSTSSLPKITILLTAGTLSSDPTAATLKSASQELRRLGVQRFVIAVGPLPEREKLKGVVDYPSRVVVAPSFDDLQGKVQSIMDQVRTEPTPTPTRTPTPTPTPISTPTPTQKVRDHDDVVFLIDSSSDITQLDYYQEKLFIKSLARELKVSPTGNQAAVMTYGNRVSIVVNFGDFTTMTAFDSAVDFARYQGGVRRIDRAFSTAAGVLSARNPTTKKTVILLTGGRTSQVPGSNSLERSARAVRDLGANVYIVAFGAFQDIQSLKPAVQKSQDIHSVPDVSRLVYYVQPLRQYIITDTGPVAPLALNYDVVFVMDSSDDVVLDDYKKEKTFISSVVRNLNLSPDRFRFSLVTYGNRASLVFRFRAFQGFSDFAEAVQNASYVGGERRMDKALDMVNRVMNEARQTASKAIVFLTAGQQTIGLESLGYKAELARSLGATLYVVAIGQKANTQELRSLVNSQRDLVLVPSFAYLNLQTTGITNRLIRQSTDTTWPRDITADVVFLLDSSDGVTPVNFGKEKEFINSFKKRLNMSPKQIRIALIAYSSYSRLAFDLGHYNSVPEFERLVDDVTYIGGTRRMDKALNAATNVLRGSDPSSPKMVVLLTAGRQPIDAPSLVESAEPLLKVGAMVYVVSIGQDVDRKEFEQVVGDPGRVHQVASFDGLEGILPVLTQGIVEGVSNRVQFDVDIVFLMDASTVESSKYFQSQKGLVKAMLRTLAISPGKVRAALVVYSNSAFVVAGFGAFTTTERFETAVDETTYFGGIRRIDEALAASARLFSESRPSAAKIVVLMTTGRQAQTPGTRPLVAASQSLRDMNAHIYVIAIGKQPDIRELNFISEKPKDVVIVPSPSDVISRVPLLSGKVIQDARKEKQPLPLNKADLIFLLDSSGDVTSSLFGLEKQFIKSIASKFQIALNKTRVAVVRYSSFATTVINFDSSASFRDLARAVDQIQYFGGRRSMDAAVREANKLLDAVRSNVPTYVILLTTGRQQVPSGSPALAQAAQSLLDSKAHVSAIGIGSGADISELRLITKLDGDIFMAPSSALLQQISLIFTNMASHPGDQLPSDHKADVLFLVDSSQNIGREKFKQEIEFVKAMARTLDLSRDKSRASIVTFGHTPLLSIQFDDYTDIHSFLRGADVVPFVGGLKRLDKVLIFAARILSKGRTDAHKIAVLITDGKQSPGADPLNVSVKPLHQLGVNVYVIGAGENADIGELSKIPSKPEDLFVSRTFDALSRQIPALVAHVADSFKRKPLHREHALFLVDSSRYRSTSEFETQIDFIKLMAKSLNVSSTGTQAGVILYNTEPQLRIRFDSYDTLSEFHTLLDDLPLIGGGRELDKALLLAEQTLQSSPQGMPKYVVVLAEGQQLTSSGVKSLADAARRLHALGAAVYVVGIGNRLNVEEFAAMVQSSEDIITVTSFTELLRKVDDITEHIGDDRGSVPCKETLDVGILMDASGSMGVDNFSREKNFVKRISDRLTSSSVNSRIGLMVFSDYTRLFVSFRDFKRLGIDGFHAQVNKLPYQGGRTRIDRSLLAASRDLFSDGRTGIPRVLILITDGRQSKDRGYTPLEEAIKPLQAQGVKVLAVGIGDEINTAELNTLTGDSDNVLLVQTFEDIDRLRRELVSKACEERK